ncbi:MAG TPA: aminotransferase class V-fold PLP-dependent enzyme [Candidatus Dormibacteraeota bacterium]|nr:aminotransferase class V-fold PLP-dependent enzyme [Candidatus Dormibacteraeota bacterium]
MTFLDVVRARKDTPGCENVLHFNNAGAALVPLPVLNSMLDHLKLEAQLGGYEAEAKAGERIERVYDAIASLLGCSREEIAIMENATRAWDLLFYSLRFRTGDRILTSVAEYASNFIAFLQVCRQTGARIEVVPNDERGQLSISRLRSMIDKRVKLVAVTHVPTSGGLVNPAAEIGTLTREAGIPFLLDACQSIGQMPINVRRIGCDALTATARKFLRGPRSIGFLYVGRKLLESLEPVFLDLHSAEWVGRNKYRIRPDARRFECWETNCAAKLGLAAAVDYALGWGLPSIWERVSLLAHKLRNNLSALPGVRLRDRGQTLCGIVTFTIGGHDAFTVLDYLRSHRINVWVSKPTSTRLDFEERKLPAMIRASVHYYNTDEEIVRFCEALSGLGGGASC